MADTRTTSTIELSVERMAYGPDAVAHAQDGKVVLVSGAVPGDRVLAELVSAGSSFDRARVVEVLEASPDRVTSACPFSDACGGCPWSHASYPAQLRFKRGAVVDALTRIGRFDAQRVESLVADCIAPGEPWGYRNKIELATRMDGGRLHLGMHASGGEDVIRVDSCPLLDSPSKKTVKSVTGALTYLAGANGIDIQRVGIRYSRRTKDLEIALWTSPSSFPRAQAAKVLTDAVKPSSIVRVLTKGTPKSRRVVNVERLAGAGSWSERIGNETMRVSAPSFFQVNTKGAEKLVELVCGGLEPEADDCVWDLYSGAGTFTMPLARCADWVEAVEIEGSSVRDLRRNLERSGIGNVNVVGGDVALEEPEEEPDLIVVDPPRSGLDNRVREMLVSSDARRIAYVSCDPATLARDLAQLEGSGAYAIDSITPVDLFPQSFHVETVVLLRNRTGC